MSNDGAQRRFLDLFGSRSPKGTSPGEQIPLVVWDRQTGGDWLHVTWLPEDHPDLRRCPHPGCADWEQKRDPSIRKPFTVQTQLPKRGEDEALFWRGMAAVVKKHFGKD